MDRFRDEAAYGRATCVHRSTTTLFGGDPIWITEAMAGMGSDGRAHGDENCPSGMLHTLYNLGPAPEPNLTILWSGRAARRV